MRTSAKRPDRIGPDVIVRSGDSRFCNAYYQRPEGHIGFTHGELFLRYLFGGGWTSVRKVMLNQVQRDSLKSAAVAKETFSPDRDVLIENH